MKKRRKKTEPKAKSDAGPKAECRVVLYRDADGTAPLLKWLDRLNDPRAVAACRVVIDLLRQYTFRLRRPHADALRDGIRELRVSIDQVQYRLLYFFDERSVVLTHGFIKRGSKVPDREIDRSIAFRSQFMANREQHTYLEVE